MEFSLNTSRLDKDDILKILPVLECFNYDDIHWYLKRDTFDINDLDEGMLSFVRDNDSETGWSIGYYPTLTVPEDCNDDDHEILYEDILQLDEFGTSQLKTMLAFGWIPFEVFEQ